MNKNTIIAVLIVVIVALGFLVWKNNNHTEQEPQNISAQNISIDTPTKTVTTLGTDMVTVSEKSIQMGSDHVQQYPPNSLPKISFAYPKANWELYDKAPSSSSIYTNLELVKTDPREKMSPSEGPTGVYVYFGLGFIAPSEVSAEYEIKCASNPCPITVEKKVTAYGVPFTTYTDTVNNSVVRVVYEVKPNLQVTLTVDDESSDAGFKNQANQELKAITEGMKFTF